MLVGLFVAFDGICFWLMVPSRPSISGFTGRTDWGVVKPLPGSGTVAQPVKPVTKRARAVREKNDRSIVRILGEKMPKVF